MGTDTVLDSILHGTNDNYIDDLIGYLYNEESEVQTSDDLIINEFESKLYNEGE